MNNKFKLILPILATLILTGAGCSLFTENTLIDLKNEDKKDVIAEPNSEVPTEVGDTSDWQTYTNEEYGFSFKYPEGYSVKNLSGESIKMGIRITNSSGKAGYEESYINILTENWINLGTLEKSNILNFNELNFETLQDIKENEEFEDSELVQLDGLVGLEKYFDKLDSTIYYFIVNNPNEYGKFLVFTYHIDLTAPQQIDRASLFGGIINSFEFIN